MAATARQVRVLVAMIASVGGLAAGCAGGPEGELAGPVAGKADDVSCVGAAIDAHGYCRLPNGRFTFTECCEAEPEQPLCDPEPRRECVFGVGTRATEQLGYLEYDRGGSVEAGDSLGALEEAQVLAAMEITGWEGIASVDEAFESIDADGFHFSDALDRATNEAYTHLQFYAGDTEVGVFFRSGTTESVAVVGDGDIYDCTATVPSPAEDPCADGPTPTLAVVSRVLADNGMDSGATLAFGEYEVYFQLPWDDGMPTFAEALDAGIKSFLEDEDDEESPLALLLDADDDPACPQQDRADRVRCYMSQPEAFLALVPRRLDLDDGVRIYPAENGESVDENWIFYLRLPGLSDHLFWAVVPHDDLAGAYNYGFN